MFPLCCGAAIYVNSRVDSCSGEACGEWGKDGDSQPLPEFLNLPSVLMFVECILSGTRQTSYLPSAALKTLGKKKHSAKMRFAECKKKHSIKRGLPSVFFFTRQINKIFFLGKKEKKKIIIKLCRVPRSRTLGKGKKIFFQGKKEKKQNEKKLCRSMTLGKGKKSFFWERKRRKKIKKNFAECLDLGH